MDKIKKILYRFLGVEEMIKECREALEVQHTYVSVLEDTLNSFQNIRDTLEEIPSDYTELNEWLLDCFGKKGFKQYYTLRKKHIAKLMMAGLKDEEYKRYIGRVEELEALKNNIESELQRRKRKEDEKNRQQPKKKAK